ncbi:MAG: potassium channel family protein [Planctomycetota bacterium]
MQSFHIQRLATTLVVIVLLIGTIGFVLIEGWPVDDSLYMTVITLSTVGYGEVQELTPKGRMFASALISISFVLVACWTSGFTSILVSGEVTGRFQNQRERKMISKMKGHAVVCGGGVSALTILHHLSLAGKDVVIITDDPKQIEMIRRTSPQTPVIEADPISEMALIDSNALSAGYLVAATESDHNNLLITISGKGLGTDVRVISFAHSTDLASRMFKVGADEVICPFVSSGEKVAEMINGDQPEACAIG